MAAAAAAAAATAISSSMLCRRLRVSRVARGMSVRAFVVFRLANFSRSFPLQIYFFRLNFFVKLLSFCVFVVVSFNFTSLVCCRLLFSVWQCNEPPSPPHGYLCVHDAGNFTNVQIYSDKNASDARTRMHLIYSFDHFENVSNLICVFLLSSDFFM